ncbi:phytochelatin synthase family protein [Aureimonas sp. AU22]|uniref:phytochelatin synthase family protein n=1 Tax=Aureimonas sp. AU22 TaxID=1638162 RepID=UPI001FCD4584|nr:phytochelatin synthase family protein [Aureimonas sp. AU22]
MNDPRRRYVVNVGREPIFGAGCGPISPVVGYLEAQDLVFVLDVNAKFGPWLIETRRLFEAMDTLDGGKKRGLLRIERGQRSGRATPRRRKRLRLVMPALRAPC